MPENLPPGPPQSPDPASPGGIPPPPPPSGPAPSPAENLLDPKWIVDRFVAVLTRPVEFFESIRGEQTYGPPVVFAGAMGLVSAVVSVLYAAVHLGPFGHGIGFGAAIGTLVVTPILWAVLGAFVGGAITHAVALVAGGHGTFESSVNIASYAAAVAPIAAVLRLVPVLYLLPYLYGFYLLAIGIVLLHASERRRTFLVVGVLALALAIFDLLAILAARGAAHLAGMK